MFYKTESGGYFTYIVHGKKYYIKNYGILIKKNVIGSYNFNLLNINFNKINICINEELCLESDNIDVIKNNNNISIQNKNITWTKSLENSSCIRNIIDPLLKSGFKEREIESILYLNLDRFFKAVLPRE